MCLFFLSSVYILSFSPSLFLCLFCVSVFVLSFLPCLVIVVGVCGSFDIRGEKNEVSGEEGERPNQKGNGTKGGERIRRVERVEPS